ncbi:uncharacterized protein HKW66_Vig0164210 [Vigna angularis]|uniref:UBP-type domain-containing protein n=1 Tax=Phaseolus angularis TaxID=3914 RepID=A0A8T0JL75_PHAAN|nr:uncharacterized protein HKW66_Vig0164210 [Vigna angularis]
MASSSSAPEGLGLSQEDYDLMYGSESGWVEARSSCDHLASLSADLSHIPPPGTPCHTCQHPSENWLCLSCKQVLCGRFVNKHMLHHFHHTNHSLALSFRYALLVISHAFPFSFMHSLIHSSTFSISDLSFWCFSCDAYLDAQLIPQLRPVHQLAYIIKFGEPPPLPLIQHQPSSATSD